mmetsp:Transcript_5240/g.7752  ORF Transcript_5240/g.7752 Transcript_5240/m.7752 type:complete len:358 (+) Transcript_5240:336-1409(+)
MHTRRTSTGISTTRKTLVPIHSAFCRTSDGLSAWHGLLGSFTGKAFFKDHTVAISFLGGRSVVGETVCGIAEHLIGHLLLRDGFQVIHPSVSNSITKLLLLSPQNLLGKVWIIRCIKSLTNRPFLNPRIRRTDPLTLLNHFLFRCQIHGRFQKVRIQKRNAGLDTPCTHGLVASQTVIHVKPADLVHSLIVEFLRIGRLVKVEVSSKDFICPFATKDHFDPHGLDLTRHEVHGRRSTDGGEIIRLEGTNDFTDRICPLVKCVGVRMMSGAQVIRYLFRCQDIGRILKSNREGMELGEGCGSSLNVARTNTCHEGTIKPPTEEDTPGDVGHHTANDGLFEGSPQHIRLIRYGGRFEPW